MFESQRDSHIFRAEATLSPSYAPEIIPGRDREIRQIAAALRPLTRRKSPDNLVVYGPAGIGKTTTVTYICDRLEDQTKTSVVRINCWQYNTRSSLLSQLLIELGYPAARKGKPVDELLLQLREWLDKNNCVVAILDEFDRHRDQTAIAYDLTNVSETVQNELGLILISNYPPSELELDPRSESRLNYTSIKFQAYSATDLVMILEERAEKAFGADTVTGDAMELIAKRVADRGGDCRHALELLHRTGRIAERANADTVTALHAEQSFNPLRE